MYKIICIFSSRHKLHLRSKHLRVVDFTKFSIELLEFNLYFSTSKNVWIKLFDFLSVRERKNEYDYYVLTSPLLTKFQYKLLSFLWENSSLIHYALQITYTSHWTVFRFTITIIITTTIIIIIFKLVICFNYLHTMGVNYL